MKLFSVASCGFPKADARFRHWRFPRAQIFWLAVTIGATHLACAQSSPVGESFQQAAQAMRAGHLEEAADGFQAVIAVQPGFAEAHFNLGLVREEQGRNEQAIVNFQKALALKPSLRGANLFLGVAEYRLNHLDKAVAALQKETASYPKDAGAWMWLGVVRLAEEHPEQAADALDKAANLAPDNVDILYQRGRAHLLVSKDSYSRMFKADPTSWHVRQVLAEADAEADRDEDAIAEYEAAIKLAPNQPGLHEELGVEYQKIGKLETAETELRQELQLDPNNVSARNRLGTLLVEQGDVAEGKETLEAALKQNPRLKNATYYLGRAEMQLGNDGAAAENFKSAVTSDSDPDIVEQSWYQLGIVYRRMHRLAEAQQALATFQKMKDEEIQQQRQTLEKKKKAQGLNDAPRDPSPKNP